MSDNNSDSINDSDDTMASSHLDCKLSTIDNPYDPYTQYDEWLRYDESMGYYTNGYLARIAVTSEEQSIESQKEEVRRAISEILKYDFIGLYIRIYPGTFVSP